MKINFEEFKKVANEGKWFEFETNLGKVAFLLTLPEKEFILSGLERKDMTLIQKYQWKKDMICKNLTNWKHLEDGAGKPLPFSKKLLENDKFYGLLSDMKVEKESNLKNPKTGKPIKMQNSLVLEVVSILSDSSRFLGDGKPSFL